MYTARQISDWILSKVDTQAGDTISPLKLQKLLYYCHAWHLTVFKKPLFDEKIEAWSHGPVIVSEYNRFSFMFRNEQIKIKNITLDPPSLEKDVEALLEEVLNIYGEHSAGYLEDLTHQETPWLTARGNTNSWERLNSEISPESIISYFSAFKK